MTEPMRTMSGQTMSRLMSAVSSTSIVASSRVGFTLFDLQGRIVECNEAAAEYFGYQRQQLLGRSGESLDEIRLQNLDGSTFSPENWPSLRTLRERCAQKDILVGVDIPGRALKWARVSTELVEVDGNVEGVISTQVDCTAEIERSQILEMGAELLSTVEAASSTTELFQSLCDGLVGPGRYRLAWIATDLEDGRGSVEIAASAGARDYLYEGIVSTSADHERGNGLIGKAFRSGQVQVSNDIINEDDFAPWRNRALEFNFWSTVAIPFQTTRSHVLTIYDEHLGVFDQSIVRGLQGVTYLASKQVQLLARLDDARRNVEGVISVLGTITEERDPYTQGHQVHVASLSEAIARSLGFDEEMVRLIELSGEVHDIGKIKVPAEILTKPGRLTALEYELVKQHCQVGANILGKASLPWPVTEVTLQHHERLDGSGYPFGLKGDDIIMPARIVAVADVVEAMMNHRPYRPALGAEVAISEIVAGKGRLFDADVVDVCVALIEADFEFSSGYR